MITAENISFTYTANQHILKDVAARIVDGEFMAILGNNGVGKSTFLYCLNRILTPKTGIITIDGKPLDEFGRTELAQNIALVAQHSHASRSTVFDSILLGRKPYIGLAPTEEDFQIVASVIQRLELDKLSLRYVDELSGGEYQKVILARALVQKTNILLLDEPTNNLDPYNQLEVMQNIRDVVDEDGIAAVAVMHDINLSLRYCDTLLFLKQGQVYAFGSADIVKPELIEAVYGITVDVITHKERKMVVPL